MTRPFLPLLLASLSLPLAGCVLVNDYGGFTVVDPDAGMNTGIDASSPDASADAEVVDAGARDGGREDAGPCLTATDTLYVAEHGDDANDGSIDAPLRTIAMALAAARGDTSIANVYVSAGTYDATYESENQIELVDGVTLRGGYSDDFCTYAPATYLTEIAERFTGDGADPLEPPIVGILGDDLEGGVVLEGFRLSMGEEGDDSHIGIRLRNTKAVIRDVVVADGDGRHMTGIMVDGASSLTMERVTLAMDNATHSSTGVHLVDVADASLSEIIIERTVADASMDTHGIHAEYHTDGPAYALRITRSRIHGGRGGSGSIGVRVADARPSGSPAVTLRLTNNLIHGGESGGTVSGVRLSGASRNVTIYNNTIYSGETDAFRHGITYQYMGAGPDIRSNVIFSSGPQQFCIHQTNGAWNGTDMTLSNNLFFDCPFFLLYDGTNEITDAAMLNALRNSMANQEASEVPLTSLTGPDLLTGTMANNDWGFKDGAPCTYTDGAFPAPELTIDYFGNPRDATPSIGAIEFTGTCTP